MKSIKTRHFMSISAVALAMAALHACAAGDSAGVADATAETSSNLQSQSAITTLINNADTQAVLASAVNNPNCAIDANRFGGMAVGFLPGAMNANNLYDPNGMFSPGGFFGSHGFDPNRTFDANHTFDANGTRDPNQVGHFPLPHGFDPNDFRGNDPNAVHHGFPGVDPNGMFGGMGFDPNGITIPGFDPNHVMDPNFVADPNRFFGDFNQVLGTLRGCIDPNLFDPNRIPRGRP